MVMALQEKYKELINAAQRASVTQFNSYGVR